jgi:hypothetical protein
MVKERLGFHTLSHSSDFSLPTTASPNICGDWARYDWNELHIDGKPLSELMPAKVTRLTPEHRIRILEQVPADKKASEKNDEDRQRNIREHSMLRTFFKEKILGKITDEDKKEKACIYLMNRLHQGGLLNPSSSATASLLPHVGLVLDRQPRENEPTEKVQFNLITDETGFILQEIHTVYRLLLINDPEDKLIADKGCDFCMQSQVTIKIAFEDDFTLESGPTFEVMNSSMSYGNSEVQSMADERAWYTRFVDFISYLLGFNTVEDLSSSEERRPSP